MAYLRSQKYSPESPNLTITSFGGHPGVKGNGHVPYYMVFDHTGALRHHHMGGAYHGGDGLKMIEWVDRLVKEAPAVWVGRESYSHVADVAARVASAKALPRTVAEIESRLQATETSGEVRAELERLKAAVQRWRDRRVTAALKMLASNPAGTLPALKSVAKGLAGTSMAAPVTRQIRELSGSDALKSALRIAKVLRRTRSALDRLKACKTCRRSRTRAFQASCSGCRQQNRAALSRARKTLEGAIRGQDTLPITATVRALFSELGG